MTAGVSWDELLEPQARPPEADPDPDDLDERGDLREMQRYCQKFAGLPGAPATGASVLTEWETRFIWSLAVSQRVLTQKQISILANLIVLSPANDPFRCDTRDGHAEGKWFADQMGVHRRHPPTRPALPHRRPRRRPQT
jgi:hypothetical protein